MIQKKNKLRLQKGGGISHHFQNKHEWQNPALSPNVWNFWTTDFFI